VLQTVGSMEFKLSNLGSTWFFSYILLWDVFVLYSADDEEVLCRKSF
jgi:hypothetical protein